MRSLATCTSKSRVIDVKRGVLMAGNFDGIAGAVAVGIALEADHHALPQHAGDGRRLLRGHPVDGVVLMGGCDKTTPGLLLGATSMNIPRSICQAGPMLRDNWKNEDAELGLGRAILGRAARRKISDKDWVDVEAGIATATAPA